MEVLVDDWGYTVSIDTPHGELERLRTGTLEGEILEVVDKDPFNVPTGKQLSLRLDPDVREMVIESYPPEFAKWGDLRRLDVRISPEEYQEIYFGTGRVYGTKPRLFTDIIVRDTNTV